MRPTRLLASLVFLFLTVFLTFYSLVISHPPENAATSDADEKHGFRSLFSWHMPSTLFPQSAIISLTDDNSTFFLSRPANYGPRLPVEGLSGQLWVGSGFSDDVILRGGASTKAEGELGCSDIPGWDPSQLLAPGSVGDDAVLKTEQLGDDGAFTPQGKAAQNSKAHSFTTKTSTSRPDEDDGSDDFLHWPLKNTILSKNGQASKGARNGRNEHADIQSLQESAEIAGKVVLLSRGGCGFLEKTKWVQRRGGMALIVGDNIRGGPLTTMYANGDASNITIPSLFTTRTTAHLLSSLIPPKSGEGSEDQRKGGDASKIKAAPEKVETTVPKTTQRSETKRAPKSRKRSTAVSSEITRQPTSWFSSILSRLGLKRNGGAKPMTSDSSRPPSSGRLNWVVSENWDDDVSSGSSAGRKDSKKSSKGKNGEKSSASSGDTFVIGVQDWRDPDMMKPDKPKQVKPAGSPQVGKPNLKTLSGSGNKELAGGSHTPGSGVYHSTEDLASAKSKAGGSEAGDADDTEGEGWFGRLFGGSSDESASSPSSEEAKAVYDKTVASSYVKEKEFEDFAEKHPTDHEGLWVTMTPTTISTTPFFDTLLVLVVSPLVTLTVVYALLIVRSRIRRRRWRAPKSVVDRLPVRTYHTMSCSSTSTSSQATSPEGSSPTSPLLRNPSRTMLSRTRPRSRTTSVLAEEVSTSLDKATAKAALSRGERKRIQPKRYNGRQIECVVCLEEYVDGQSRVMSLPCGHEFHAECITPWLTTRRRTCPICKGDVVRSMASASSNSSSSTDISSAGQLLGLPNVDDVQAEAANTRNESPSAAIPIPQGEDSDLERGDDLAATLVNDESSSSSTWNWRELASRSLSAVRGESWRRTQEDRSR